MLTSALTTFYSILFEPFVHHAFMQRALLGCIALSLGCGSVGAFLVLRRMSLVADALSHGLFPGVCLAFLFCGFNAFYLGLGGALSGLVLGLLAYGLSCRCHSSKDSTFALLVLFSIALGLFVLTTSGGYTDVMHILVGNVLVLSNDVLFGMGCVATFTLLTLVVFYRPFVLQAFDVQFFNATYKRSFWVDALFLILLTLNVVCSLQALGSLMAMGLLLVPAITARLFAKQIITLCLCSTFLGILASIFGLLFSYHAGYPTGPVIVLTTLLFYGLGLLSRRFISFLQTIVLVFVMALLSCFWLPPLTKKVAKPQVVVSFTILEDFVQELSGDLFHVKCLVGPNKDPHMFEPTPQDIKTLHAADLVIVNGFHLENHWLQPFLEKNKMEKVVVATRTCTPLFFYESQQKIPDPHAWHNVMYALKYVEVIEEALTTAFPKHTQEISKRAQRYKDDLRALDAWVKVHKNMIPSHLRCALTTHDGFRYFEEAYGFTFLAPLGPSTDAEPTAKQLATLLEAARKKNVRAVFFENMVAPHTLRMLTREGNLKVGGTLYSDALSEKDGPAPTYIQMIKHNVKVLCAALQPNAFASTSPLQDAS